MSKVAISAASNQCAVPAPVLTCYCLHTIVIEIARTYVGRPFGRYSLFHNNCEHFATYCKTGMGLDETAPEQRWLVGCGHSLSPSAIPVSRMQAMPRHEWLASDVIISPHFLFQA
jgi:hypothetical protein